MEEGGGGEGSVHQWVGRGRVCAMEGSGGGLEWVGLDVKERKKELPPHTHTSLTHICDSFTLCDVGTHHT